MSQDGSARSDLPAGGQEELGGVSHSERMLADMMKMLANLTMQNQQLLQQHLQQQQQTAAAAGDRGLQQQMETGEGGRIEESGGSAREGRVVDSSGPLVGETVAKLESLSGEEWQASLAGSYPGFRVAGQAPVQDVPRRDGQRGKCGTIRGFSPAREPVAMFGFGPGVSGMNKRNGFKPGIPVFNGEQESFSR